MTIKQPKISIPANSGDLAKAVIAGDKKAGVDFYKKVIPVLFGYIMGKYSAYITDEDGEEIMSDVLVRMVNSPFKTQHSGKIATKELSCWLTKTVKSVYVDRVRYEIAQKRGPLKKKSPDTEEPQIFDSQAGNEVEQGEFSRSIMIKRAIDLALKKYSELECRAIKYYFLEECSVEETAGKYGITAYRFNSRLSAFRRELTEILGSYDKNARKFRFIR